MLLERQALYATQPPEDDAVLLCVKAWHALASCRPIFPMGGGVGSIPWNVIRDWAMEHGLDRESRALLYEVLGYVEGERIRLENAKARLKNATGGR